MDSRFNINDCISNDIEVIINFDKVPNESIVQYILESKLNITLEELFSSVNYGISKSNLDLPSKSKLRGYIISRLQSSLMDIFN